MNFWSPYGHEFIRVACCVPRVEVGDPSFNVAQTLDLARQGDERKIALMIFPSSGSRLTPLMICCFRMHCWIEFERGIVEMAEASRAFFPALRRWRPVAAPTGNCLTARSSFTAARWLAWCQRVTYPIIGSSTRGAISHREPRSAMR